MAVEEQIIAENAEIIWMSEERTNFQPGTAASCRSFVTQFGPSDQGLCVGDGQTMLDGMSRTSVFDDSGLAVGRGLDLIIRRSTMVIEFNSAHGTPPGNENLTGQELLQELQAL